MSQTTSFFPLEGGLDLVTPAIKMPPGRVVAALNYEPTAQGYKRLRGYERFDGRDAPSDVTGYHVVHFTGGDADLNSVVAGSDFIVQGVASAQWRALALAVPTITSGTTGAGTAAGYIGVTFVGDAAIASTTSGNLRFAVTGAIFAVLDGAAVTNEVVTGSATWLAGARTVRRNKIAVVPGSGPVRGVWASLGVNSSVSIIAVRDNAGATAGIMHATGSSVAAVADGIGWTAVAVALTFTFNSGGTAEITVGTDLEGATSSASGRVVSIALTSGSWAGGDAAGSMVLTVTSGTFQSGENVDIDGGAANVATITNAGTAYALPAGGAYEFINHNFYGASDLTRTYGVNGVGKAFEYDAATLALAPITTGMTTDTPNHLAEHNGALFLSFPGGSVQYSTIGQPLTFDPILGAGEIGVGSDVTFLASATKSALAIGADHSISVLYGHDSSDYLLETLTDQAGAIAYSAQKIGQLIYLDNGGLRSLAASAQFGNFNFGSLSQLVAPLLEAKREAGVEPTASFVIRRHNQYWLLFDDGTGIAVSLNKKQPEILPVNLGITVTCSCSVEIYGEERIFLGASDGYVYEFDKGTSFDGAVIPHNIELPYFHFGAPQIEKRLHKLVIDLETSGTTTLTAEARYDNGVSGVAAQSIVVTNGSGNFDSGDVYIDGVARSVSAKIAGSTSTEEPHTLTGATYLYSVRRLVR